MRIYITGIGLISPLGSGLSETRDAIRKGKRGISPITLFPVAQNSLLPVGQVRRSFETGNIPRTHQLALIAAREAMSNFGEVPDAVVMGVTTGGMLSTEEHLKRGDQGPGLFTYHSTGSVAEYIAGEFNCKGPAITISTACSSGAAAIKVALEMLRSGKAGKILVGGADSLCRLTYYGFNSLQLIDPEGARPLDINRHGMTVSEGAGMLLLVASPNAPDNAVAEILGAGLSCDAYHPASPHPEGAGALSAMQAAIKDADISLTDIDYINLHGTGTVDNDLSESKALNRLFGNGKPPMSSIKGASGHPLAASGAIDSVICAMSISDNLVPGNTGCDMPDPALGLNPAKEAFAADIQTVLSNSFGFGGNNASVVIGRPEGLGRSVSVERPAWLSVMGSACITGAGDADKTVESISNGRTCKGMLSDQEISLALPARSIRRLKRLTRMALSLATAAHGNSGLSDMPSSIFFGTGWGGLSETYDFLSRLFESDEQFASPTDFIGSVHNAPAGQIAIQFKSTGPNITTTGGDASFEQSLFVASLLARDIDETMLVIGADESHKVLSRLFDRSVSTDRTLSDGGGALCLKRSEKSRGLRIFPSFFENSENNPSVISSLISKLGNQERIHDEYGAILVGIPGAHRKKGQKQLDEFLSVSGFMGPIIDYRTFTGEFASASAVAAVLALRFVQAGEIHEGLTGKNPFHLKGKGMLAIGLGNFVTAIEVII